MEIKSVSREEMLKRVAYFKDLTFRSDRYPDSQLPGNERRNYAVIGPGLSIAGAEAPDSAIPIQEGFNLSMVEARPGNGPKLHVHDGNETFVPITGRWRVYWGLDDANYIDIGPADTISVPAYVPRRFVNITEGDKDQYSLLLGVLIGDAPLAAYVNDGLAAGQTR